MSTGTLPPLAVGVVMSLILTGLVLGADNRPGLPSVRKVWESNTSTPGRIVIEQQGYPFTNKDGKSFLIHSEYIWRYSVNEDESGGSVLLRIPGDYAGATGREPEEKPVTVLFADVVNGQLLTAFDQNREIHGGSEGCWAFVVDRKADGSLVQRPGDGDGSPPGEAPNILLAGSIGRALRTASMAVSRGMVVLTGADMRGKLRRYQLVSWPGPKGQGSFYWRELATPTTTKPAQ